MVTSATDIDLDVSDLTVVDRIAGLDDDVIGYEGDDDEQQSDADGETLGADDVEGEETKAEGDEGEEQPEAEAEADAEDPEFEIEESGAKRNVKLSELRAAYSNWSQVKDQAAQVVERIQTQRYEAARAEHETLANHIRQQGEALTAYMRALPRPQMPNTEMLNAASPNYNPDLYHQLMAQYQNGQAFFGKLNDDLQLMREEYAKNQQQALAAQTEQEFLKLQRLMPEFGKPETARAKLEEFQKGLAAYGIASEEFAAVVDHRQYLIIRDALAYRALQNKSKAAGVPAKKVAQQQGAQKPNVARKTAAAGPQQRQQQGAQNRGKDGKFVNNQRAALKKTGRIEHAAALFERFIE